MIRARMINSSIQAGDKFQLQDGRIVTIIEIKEGNAICADDRGRKIGYGLEALKRVYMKKI